ncbi:VCBS repeat-containing protein [Streptomyces sp. MBT42]|uniref:FG-GAP repeat domain-containing protein n=1 Tax=Streptomyces sp. MBT42 TaxID=1488373 RepID=UPI001E4896BB|nr:VCBS repeat-containing protein [Streptomyces sp. MBT42]MCD2465389.1 VCBS repeat-containing protein [Streptomyces sp. MBT42]
MPLARSTRRRLTGAVTTVLAVTLGATSAAPAHAAPAAGRLLAADAKTTADPIATADPIGYPGASRLVGAGVTGFLTTSNTAVTTFRRYSDGAGQAYDGAVYLRSTPTTDFLVFRDGHKITQRNLTTSGSLEIPVGSLPGDAKWAGAASDAVFTTVVTDAGTVLRKHVDETAEVTVTGLPTDATSVMVTPATPSHAKVTFIRSGLGSWGLLDLATGVLTLATPGMGAQAVSATHIAWTSASATDQGPRVFAADRATGTVQEAPVPPVPSLGNLQVGLVGDWVLYGQKGGMSFAQPSAHHAITAYNLTTRTTVKVLDHAYEFTSAPDGSLYARGGVVGRGEGMYRIAATGGDSLKAELIAATSRPTEVVATASTVPPAVLDLDRVNGFVFRWTLSRDVWSPKITIRHVRTGKTQVLTSLDPSTSAPVVGWVDNNWDESVPNGDYTWEMTGEPVNGIGPAVTAKGAFKVVRKVQPHDFNDNGSPDMLSRDSAGRLWRTDLFYRPIDERRGINEAGLRTPLGSGWGVYDRIEAVGNLGGTAVGDLLARDTSGVLWLYQGTGTGNFATRVQVGGGWQAYDKITSGSDLTGDGRVDALATDRSGVLWLYSGTGNATKPFLTRKKVGAGWGIYNDITAVADIAGGSAGDLVARDKDGVLWLYLGKGDGTFAPRTKIGGGWNAFRPLIAAGDADGDGRPDLMGLGADYETPKLYKSTGDWKTPFRSGEIMNLDQVGAITADPVF